MRKFAAVVFAGLILYGSGIALHAVRSEAGIDLIQVVQGTGATLFEVAVDAWCVVSEPVPDAETAGRVLEKVLAGMGLEDTGPIQLETLSAAEELGPLSTYEAKLQTDLPSGAVLLAAVQSTEYEGQQEAYLILSLYDRSQQPKLGEMYALLTRERCSGCQTRKSDAVGGHIAGRLTPDETAEIVTQVMTGTGAEMKNIYQSGDLVSVSGYSPRLEASTGNFAGLVNVNLAMRYDEEEGRPGFSSVVPASGSQSHHPGGLAVSRIHIQGGYPLNGKVEISGAKNAALPILAASLLAVDGESTLAPVPMLNDVVVMLDLLQTLGRKLTPMGLRRYLSMPKS